VLKVRPHGATTATSVPDPAARCLGILQCRQSKLQTTKCTKHKMQNENNIHVDPDLAQCRCDYSMWTFGRHSWSL